MITYYEIKYRMNDPENEPRFAGDWTANIVADTEDEARESLLGGVGAMNPDILSMTRKEMTEEEYEGEQSRSENI